MIPLKDTVPSSRVPVVNYALIGVCSVVFVAQLAQGERGGEAMIWAYGMVPARVFAPDEPIVVREPVFRRTPFGLQRVVIERVVPPTRVNPWWTLLTCIFLHGGWLHVIGNMWFLHIFGDNIEDRLGHFGYAAFYLGCGVAASAVHLATNSGSTLPTIGASGAVAGVMGAYLVLNPHGKVLTAIPIFYFLEVVLLPAPVFLGVWFVLQAFQGTMSITATETGGVAWWAHIGGFIAGFLTAFGLRLGGLLHPLARRLAPPTSGWGHYRVGPRW